MAMCKANSEAADELGNPELARIWQLASKVALAASEIGEKNEKGAWAHCPNGKALALILVEPPPPVQRLSDCGSARLCLH